MWYWELRENLLSWDSYAPVLCGEVGTPAIALVNEFDDWSMCFPASDL